MVQRRQFNPIFSNLLLLNYDLWIQAHCLKNIAKCKWGNLCICKVAWLMACLLWSRLPETASPPPPRDNFTKRLYENCVTETQLTLLNYAYIWRRNKHHHLPLFLCSSSFIKYSCVFTFRKWTNTSIPSRNSWQLRPHWNAMKICLQGKTKAHCSKESTGPAVRVGEPNRLFTCEKVVSPTRITLAAEARQLASPSCLALPSCLTHLM